MISLSNLFKDISWGAIIYKAFLRQGKDRISFIQDNIDSITEHDLNILDTIQEEFDTAFNETGQMVINKLKNVWVKIDASDLIDYQLNTAYKEFRQLLNTKALKRGSFCYGKSITFNIVDKDGKITESLTGYAYIKQKDIDEVKALIKEFKSQSKQTIL
jgi:hypothetical protein